MSPTTSQLVAKPLKSQKTFLDLESFEDVTLVKEKNFTPVTNHEEVMARVGNSAERFLQVVNEGLRSMEQNAMRRDENIPWRILKDDGTVGEVYNGVTADSKVINPIVLNLAKAGFGYLQAKTPEAKAQAKMSAINAIKASPAILEGIKQQAAAAEKEDEEE